MSPLTLAVLTRVALHRHAPDLELGQVGTIDAVGDRAELTVRTKTGDIRISFQTVPRVTS